MLLILLGVVSSGFAYVRYTTMVEMRDGVDLATDYYIPDGQGEGPWPAVLIRTPYNKGNTDPELVSAFTDRSGFVLVVQNTRGRFESEGIDSVFLDDGWGENQDGYDCVEWVAGQEFCDGEVGTWGASADGITQYMMAGAVPPHLKAQFVLVAAPSLYHYVVFPGGEFRKRDIELWLLAQGSTYMLSMFDAHPNYDSTWARVNLEERLSYVDVPIYHVAGWYDLFLEGNLDAFSYLQSTGGEGARGNQKLLVGPWTHGTLGERDPGDLVYPSNASSPDLEEETLRWFAYWLKGEDNGIMQESRVKYYQMGDPASGITEEENTWIEADTWPVPSHEFKLYLKKDRSLDSIPSSRALAYREFDYDPDNPTPTVGGRNLVLAAGPKDQTGIEPGILTYTSQVLEQPIKVAGKITARIWISTNRTDTDFSVRLCDVYPDGRSMLVGDGILRARFHDSPEFADPQLLEPDSIYEIEVDLWSSAVTFARGHRIRVGIASSNYPRFEPNPNTGVSFRRNDPNTQIAENRIYSDTYHPSQILLPIPGEEPAIKEKDGSQELVVKGLVFDEGLVRFNLGESGVYRIVIFDVLGRRVFSRTAELEIGENRISLAKTASGVYFLRIIKGDQKFTGKVMVIN